MWDFHGGKETIFKYLIFTPGLVKKLLKILSSSFHKRNSKTPESINNRIFVKRGTEMEEAYIAFDATLRRFMHNISRTNEKWINFRAPKIKEETKTEGGEH